MNLSLSQLNSTASSAGMGMGMGMGMGAGAGGADHLARSYSSPSLTPTRRKQLVDGARHLLEQLNLQGKKARPCRF